MKGPKIFTAALVCGALAVSAVPVAAAAGQSGSAAGSAGVPAFKHYVACGVTPKAKPAHRCPAGSKKGAFFKSTKADVDYSICVDFPRGKTLCAKAQPAEQGTLYVNRITSTIPGVHTVTWFVKGKKIASFSFRVT